MFDFLSLYRALVDSVASNWKIVFCLVWVNPSGRGAGACTWKKWKVSLFPMTTRGDTMGIIQAETKQLTDDGDPGLPFGTWIESCDKQALGFFYLLTVFGQLRNFLSPKTCRIFLNYFVYFLLARLIHSSVHSLLAGPDGGMRRLGVVLVVCRSQTASCGQGD